MTSIGNYVFYDCSSLTSITIPDSVTSIGNSAFSGCSSLTSITIPDSVTIVGSSAFNRCSSLTSIMIPDSVTSIGQYSFYGCKSLVIICNSDSYAHSYVLENNLRYDLTSGHSYKHYKIAAQIGVAGKEYDECTTCGNVINQKTLAALKPATTTITKLTAAKKAFTAKWKKGSGITGYQIQYGLKSNFKGAKTVKITKASTVSKKITKLKAKKKYYVRIRTYKTVSGKTYYSSWSKAKTVKTK